MSCCSCFTTNYLIIVWRADKVKLVDHNLTISLMDSLQLTCPSSLNLCVISMHLSFSFWLNVMLLSTLPWCILFAISEQLYFTLEWHKVKMLMTFLQFSVCDSTSRQYLASTEINLPTVNQTYDMKNSTSLEHLFITWSPGRIKAFWSYIGQSIV